MTACAISRAIAFGLYLAVSAAATASCFPELDATETKIAPNNAERERRRVQVRSLARDVADGAFDLVQAALKSPRGSGYGMIPPEDPLFDSPEHIELKRLEAAVRRLFDKHLPVGDHIRFAYLAYGDFILFGERPFPTEEERQHWRESSGGDMNPGDFRSLRLGDPVDPSSEDFGLLKGGFYVGVPVVHDGGYAGAVYMVLDLPADGSNGTKPNE